MHLKNANIGLLDPSTSSGFQEDCGATLDATRLRAEFPLEPEHLKGCLFCQKHVGADGRCVPALLDGVLLTCKLRYSSCQWCLMHRQFL